MNFAGRNRSNRFSPWQAMFRRGKDNLCGWGTLTGQ